MPISDDTRATATRLIRRYPVARSALLPLLHLVQSEQGCITDEGIGFCAEMLGLTKAEVGAVSTFYTMFKREPVGDWLISICTNPTCKNAGAQDIYERFKDKLGGHHDEESGVSVEHAECLGICDAAPVIQVNYEMYGPLPDDEVDALLDGCMKGEPPASNWSNEVPKTWREVEYEFSGAKDTWGDRLHSAAREQVEAEVPPSYRTGETDLPVTHPGGDPKGVGGEVFRERTGATAREDEPAAEEPRPDESSVADEQDTAAPEGTGGGVAEERADQADGGTGPSPATQDQPDVAGEGDVPATETSDEEVDTTDAGVTESPEAEAAAGEDEPGPEDLPEETQSDDATTTTPDLDDTGSAGEEGDDRG